MLPYTDGRLTRAAFGLFFLVVIAYAYFEARGILFGPRIHLNSTQTISRQQFVRIEGTTERITSLVMNGAEITVTEDGAFNEPYLLSPGSNRIVFAAKDKYGNSTESSLELYFVDQSTSSANTLPLPPFASSTNEERTGDTF
jgi:hypothetical protein